jgi:Tfp pilus assembly protein PilF
LLQLLGVHYWPPKKAFPEAKKALERALELDNSLAEVHVSLGWVLMLYDRDWVSAERAFQQALRRNPNLSAAYGGYGMHCGVAGRLDEAITHLRRAQELDPLAPNLCSDLACIYFWARQPDRAHAEVRRALDLDSNFLFAHMYAALFAAVENRYTKARAAVEQTRSLAKDFPAVTALGGFIEARAGNQAGARAALDQLHADSARRYVQPNLFASLHAALGENDEAFRWLDRANEDRAVSLMYLGFDSMLESLCSDRRFKTLLRTVGVPAIGRRSPLHLWYRGKNERQAAPTFLKAHVEQGCVT